MRSARTGAPLAALAIALVAPGLAAQQTPLDRAIRAYASLRTVQAGFEQVLTSPSSASSRTSRGEFVQQGALRFAFRFTEPAGDAIVADGAALWVYLPSTARGQVLKLPREAGAGLDLVTELLRDPRAHYNIDTIPDVRIGPHQAAGYALTPKGAAAPFSRATLWIGRADALLWQFEVVEPSGLVRRVRFSSIRTDVTLPAGALAFRVPDGVRVVDQAAMLGGKKP